MNQFLNFSLEGKVALVTGASYGKDVRGLNRLHEFSKVELVRIDKPEHSKRIIAIMSSVIDRSASFISLYLFISIKLSSLAGAAFLFLYFLFLLPSFFLFGESKVISFTHF